MSEKTGPVKQHDGKKIFIGVGNDMRRDDGIGRFIVRELREKMKSANSIYFAESHGEGSSLMELWRGYDKVVIFDAVRRNGNPGKRYYLQAIRENIPQDFFRYSSHSFSLAEAIELARVLGKLPDSVEVYGIEGADFSYGEGLSPGIHSSCLQLVEDFPVGN